MSCVQVLSCCTRLDTGLPAKTMTDAVLSILHRFPELIIHNSKGWNTATLPLLGGIRAGHAFAGRRILHVGAAISFKLTDVGRVVEETGATSRLPPDRRV